MTHARVLIPACLAAAAAAVDVPRIDMLGGASFTDTYVGIGLSSTDARARDAHRDFSTLMISGSAYSVSGYPAAANPKVGGLLGGALLLRAWAAHDNDVDWTAFDPCLALVGGGFWKPVDGLRFNLTGEAGPGLDFSRLDDGAEVRTSYFRPTFHAGVHLAAMARVDPRSDIGVIVGYDWDRLPYVTAEGPFIALAFTWNAAAKADKPAAEAK